MTTRESMHEMRDAFVGNFFDSMFLPDMELIPLIICASAQANTVMDARKKLIDRPILYFAGEHHEGHPRGLILNKLNYCLLMNWLGPDEKAWFGKAINIRKHYMPDCGNACAENDTSLRIAAPPGTPLPKRFRRVVGQAWRYGTPEPANWPKTTTPVRPNAIPDEKLAALPEHEQEAYFLAWLEFCHAKQPAAVEKINAKAAKMLKGRAKRLEIAPTPEMDLWTAAIEALRSRASCAEFRDQMLPTCPDKLCAEVAAALAKHEAGLEN